MTKYRYFGQGSAAYPDVVIPGEGSLWVEPGDVKELDENPDPRWFIEEADTASKPDKAPPRAAPANSNPDQVTVGE